MAHCLDLCRSLISIYISSLYAGNTLEFSDLQLCGALLRAFVYCTTLGWCSGMQNRRGHHTVEAISETVPAFLRLPQMLILNVCVNIIQANYHHLPPDDYCSTIPGDVRI